jgi:flagellar basal-body rod protein FlgG
MMTAATGMEAQQLYMDNISNNLANVNTTAFKRSKLEFQDLMYQALREPGTRNVEGAVSPAGIEVGLGVKTSSTQRNFSQGSLNMTGNSLDWAIEGEGMYQVTLPDGTMAYSRDGSFKLSNDGTIVNSSGFYIFPQVSIPQGASALSVSPEGILSAKMAGEEGTTELGQVELVRFVNPSGLKSLGGNLFAESDASGTPQVLSPGQDGMGVIRQNYSEASNVQVVEEMVNMISAQRAYEIVSKAITVSDDMLSVANNIKR